MRAVDLSGQRFGRLIASHVVDRTKRGQAIWHCGCDCGKMKQVQYSNLRSGCTQSCGCLHTEKLREHGRSTATHRMIDTREYKSWTQMRSRCNSPTHHAYKDYGGRGITVCDRWNSFENFLKDMGLRPLETSLDRIDNSKGYSPENCRWTDKFTQARNRRKRNG